MLRISWRDKVKKTEVLSQIGLKMAYARHVLRGSSGNSAMLNVDIGR